LSCGLFFFQVDVGFKSIAQKKGIIIKKTYVPNNQIFAQENIFKNRFISLIVNDIKFQNSKIIIQKLSRSQKTHFYKSMSVCPQEISS
jgi:hypothetical protein